MHGMPVTRKSPIIIVRNYIALQFASAGLYLFAGSLAHYAHLWRAVPIVGMIPFQIAQTVFIFMMETVLILYIFLLWYRETIQVRDGRITHARGVLVRRRAVVPLAGVASAMFRQSPLGRLTHYGTVQLRDTANGLLMELSAIPEPRQFVELLKGRRPEISSTGPADIQRLVAEPEHELLERKSTLRWDVRTGAINKSLEKAALKTVAAFMNSQGGNLLLGVGDRGEAVGLSRDIDTLGRKDLDGLQNHFSNVLAAVLGPSFRQYVHLQPFTHEAKICMLVSVAPADRPAFLRDQEHEEFFIRTGNGTSALRLSEATAYISTRFPAARL